MMWKASFLQAIKATRSHWVGLIVVGFIGFVISLALYWLFWGLQTAFNQALFGIVAIAGATSAVVLLFILNWIRAPYLIERALRLEAERRGSELQPLQNPRPDWPIYKLMAAFYNINGYDFDRQTEFMDQASLDVLSVWGRRFDGGGMNDFLDMKPALHAIDPSFWRTADLKPGAYDEDTRTSACHAENSEFFHTEIMYCDLMLNKQQALMLWPNLKNYEDA